MTSSPNPDLHDPHALETSVRLMAPPATDAERTAYDAALQAESALSDLLDAGAAEQPVRDAEHVALGALLTYHRLLRERDA